MTSLSARLGRTSRASNAQAVATEAIDRGRDIFKSLVEYPLPRVAGTRDYVFYFVLTDGYGSSARDFFKKFYPNHVGPLGSDREPRVCKSLEELIAFLYEEITQRGVQRIREVTIVAHGSSQGLILPVLNAATSTTLLEYKYLTAFSLACLQKDFGIERFTSFRDQRRAVVAKLTEESWITIRACSFGSTRDGMYATHAFFGGRANVYAPTVFQLFGPQPLVEGMRIPTRLAAHQHLVKQHFIPRDIHTPERKDALVQALLNPGWVATPFEIASMRVSNPRPPDLPPDVARYEAIIDGLNAGTIPAELMTQFEANQWSLSPAARVVQVSKHTQWIIRDELKHENTSFPVEYQVTETIASSPGNVPIATLSAAAHLVAEYSAAETLPLQLFLLPREHDIWRGKLATLASYEEGPHADATLQAEFDQAKARFTSANSAGVAALLHAADIEIGPTPTVALESSSGSGTTARSVWKVTDGTHRYQVKIEHGATADGFLAHALSVFTAYPDIASSRRAELEAMSYLGQHPDTPGTELAACLDRFSIEDLVSLIDYLRAPYKPQHAFYIHQAIEALTRKKTFRDWHSQHEPIDPNAVLVAQPSHAELSRGESADRDEHSYSFDFNDIWREVRASDPPLITVQADLFAEEDLARRLGISPEEILARAPPPDLDSDAPFTDVAALREIARAENGRFFATEKSLIESRVDHDCQELGAALVAWKEVGHLDAESIRWILGQRKTAKGTSFLDIVMDLKSKYGFLKNMLKLAELAKLPSLPSKKWLAELIIKDVPFLSRITLLTTLFQMEFVITVPMGMWFDFMERQEEAATVWENVGRRTALRQWLTLVKLFTFAHETDFPDTLPTDVSTPVSDRPYYIGRYFEQQVEDYGHYSPLFLMPDRMQKGFDAVQAELPRLAERLIGAGYDSIDDVLRAAGLDSCKVKVLLDADLLDLRRIRALIVRQVAEMLLDKLPKV